jgi:hypothetical protein
MSLVPNFSNGNVFGQGESRRFLRFVGTTRLRSQCVTQPRDDGFTHRDERVIGENMVGFGNLDKPLGWVTHCDLRRVVPTKRRNLLDSPCPKTFPLEKFGTKLIDAPFLYMAFVLTQD